MSDNQKKLLPFAMLFRGAFIYNPVLVQVIGICPIVAATVSLYAAAVLSAITFLLLIICETFASVALKRVPAWIRVAIYMVIGLLIVCPAMYYMDSRDYGVVMSIGIYLPLLAVSSLVALRCEKFAVRSNPLASFIDAFSAGLGYSVVFLIVGAIRELLGSGAIAGRVIVTDPLAPGLLMTFGGFTVLGLLSALHKAIVIRFFPRFEKDMVFRIKTSRAEEQRASSVRGSVKKSSALNRAETTKPDAPNSQDSGISQTQQVPETTERLVYIPDIPVQEEDKEELISDSEVLPLEETSLEIASDYKEPQPLIQRSSEITAQDEGTTSTEKEIPPPAADKIDEGDYPQFMAELDDEFERDISELFENFRKKHNLDD